MAPIPRDRGGTNPVARGVGDGTNMLTNVATIADRPGQNAVPVTAQKVVIVNGSPESLDVLETVLDAGHYDVVFIESSQHAYSQIKRVQPNLVILCVRIDDAEGFQVLSMLKLDDKTRGIPVLTYTTEYDSVESEEEVAEVSEAEMFTGKAAVWMN
jgi:PleD family two-component response regulator